MITKMRDFIKRNRNSDNKFIHLTVAFIYRAYDMLRFIKRFCLNSEFRSMHLTRFLHPSQIHQTTPATARNRYPHVFIDCIGYFAGKEDIKILSFGCSTGEEVLTLRDYFPNATIVGADINKRSLKICRKLHVDSKISFIHSSPRNLRKLGTFDVIFCMAVFQRTPHYIASKGITDISDIYPFNKFEKQIVFLRDLINPKGLLVVHFTQYSLADTCASHGFIAYGNCTQWEYRLPVFDKNGRMIENAPPFHSIFIKV